MYKVITCIFLLVFSFKVYADDQSYSALTVSKLLIKLEEDLNNNQTSDSFYKALDEISKKVDGAYAEYYAEIYVQALIHDCENLKKFITESGATIDIDVLSFFSQFASYSQKIARSIRKCEIYNGIYVVADEDGYVNLRENVGQNYIIKDKVDTGEIILKIEESDNNWDLIVTDNGRIGYIHRSRLKLLSR